MTNYERLFLLKSAAGALNSNDPARSAPFEAGGQVYVRSRSTTRVR